MHRGFIIYDDLWHGTLLLKESASKLTFMPSIVVATSCLAIYYFQAAGTAL